MSASATAGASPVSNASVTILAPVTAHEEATLTFGSIDAASSPVALTVEPDGTTRCSVDRACRGGAAPAIFVIGGTAGERIGLTVSNRVTLTSPAGDTIEVSLSLPSPQIDLVASVARVAVGGKITVPAGQAPGAYQGVYHFDVSYQ
ncbi:DUF4402 domain-containing protein [Sphingomonas sp. AR_OL41]|uniref:DUF4402 domain-containing protein n=1 Tax=Sphingomonas sp. AR_OL41 TaxID=3042729 RepID=UPI002480D8E2|nr:DUF4402 domain-containing protein [Sphingomonas sp. AR_OL41]MDH7973279.1 DUF4402 domain-containing protein [Sphingomonas sp. AR_OL41]